MAKRNESFVTKRGRELLGQKMIIDRLATFGSQDALLEYFQEMAKFPKTTLSSLENGKSSPTVDNLVLLSKMAEFAYKKGKPFLFNPSSGKPFSAGELIEILCEELNPLTGERYQEE